jgi:ATP-dependent exoDNAse (exonuclease V) beta subunit
MPPARYSDAQWEVLGTIAYLLPLAVAQLKLVFAARGEADFAEIADGALLALGEADAPTDLMLALDYRIQHILVDEFQDTSITQYRLMESLTAGWQPGDGRTLFLVGDPMQSIYRFREAEVGLFLRARREGIGAVRLHPLALRANFRSQAGIVDWVNRSFARILPREEDYAAGAVSYTSSTAVHPALAEAVRVHAFFDDEGDAEAVRVVDLVRAALADGEVAILVRGRNHLARIVPALKRAGIRYSAIEIDTLDRRQPVQDLLSLARAVSHADDRPAWLAVLRAPWCGLTLADLHALCGPAPDAAAPPAAPNPRPQLELFSSQDAAPPSAAPGKPKYPDERTLWELMRDEPRLARLSSDGRARLERARGVLDRALAARARDTLRARVESAWLALGGPAVVEDETDLEDIERFLDYLGEREQAGEIADRAAFEAGIAKLHAAPDLRSDGSVQIMTVHKAKGLEFDTVIVPGLGKAPPKRDPSLLLWTERATRDGAAPAVSSLLLAPIKEAGTENDAIYSYLVGLDRERESYEDARVLYVAATRAKKRVHLLGSVKGFERNSGGEASDPKPLQRSLLEKLWPAVRDDFAQAALAAEPARARAAGGEAIDQHLRRLPADWRLPRLDVSLSRSQAAERDGARDAIEFSWAGETARRIGSVVHRWLQRIAADEMRNWDRARLEAMRAQFRRQLAARGVAEEELDRAATRVLAALGNATADARGRWLLGPQRGSRNEYRLTGVIDGERRDVIVDRTFVDATGRRWIVDYKTSSHEGADVEDFLDRERERYSAQLTLYAKILSPAARPRLGLYFPLVSGWREWE